MAPYGEAKEQLGSEGLTARTAGENALDVDFEILKTAIREKKLCRERTDARLTLRATFQLYTGTWTHDG